jgi:hypothetical protein
VVSVLSSTGIGFDDLRQKECRHAVIRFRDNPEHIIPESFPIPETVLSIHLTGREDGSPALWRLFGSPVAPPPAIRYLLFRG